MAYFSNGTSGEVLEAQCDKCKLKEGPCPIYFVQVAYNYDALNNKVATNILDGLIKNNGTCAMYNAYKAILQKAIQEQEALCLKLE